MVPDRRGTHKPGPLARPGPARWLRLGDQTPESLAGGHARIPVRQTASRRSGPALPQASRSAHASHVRALLATGPFLPSTNHSDASPQPESTQHASSRRSYSHLDRQHVPRLRHTNLTGPDRSTRTPIRQAHPYTYPHTPIRHAHPTSTSDMPTRSSPHPTSHNRLRPVIRHPISSRAGSDIPYQAESMTTQSLYRSLSDYPTT